MKNKLVYSLSFIKDRSKSKMLGINKTVIFTFHLQSTCQNVFYFLQVLVVFSGVEHALRVAAHILVTPL